MASKNRPQKGKVDETGAKLLTTSQFAKAVGIHPTTCRRWCDENRVVFTKGSGGRRWISTNEVDRIRNEDSSTTVNKAIERIEASVSERDGELRDIINEKSGIQKRNFEILGEKIDSLQKTLDRLQPGQRSDGVRSGR